MIVPTRAEFRALAAGGRLVPVYRELLADHETPVSAFRKLDDGAHAFLLESLEGGEKWGRYSILGSRPAHVFVARGNGCEVIKEGAARPLPGRPADELAALLEAHRAVGLPGLPRFCGGAVGYLAHEAAGWFGPASARPGADPGLPDAVFMFSDVTAVFDHFTHNMKVVTHARGGDDPGAAWDAAAARLDETVARLERPLAWPGPGAGEAPPEPSSSSSPERFQAAAARALERLRAGDLLRLTLAHRMSTPVRGSAFEAYRALRVASPSPCMHFLRLGDLCLAGSSPEVLVRRSDDALEVHPVAGARPRGRTGDEDRHLEDLLLASDRARAEHVMQVDSGRSDLGRLCEYGTIETPELMRVERRSRFIHLVSGVRGRARPGIGPLDVVRACFPAASAAGLPRSRALEVIAELEQAPRGVHGGAVGHFDYHGNLELCAARHTLVYRGGTAQWGAASAVTADSDPRAAWQESLDDARALWLAVRRGEGAPA